MNNVYILYTTRVMSDFFYYHFNILSHLLGGTDGQMTTFTFYLYVLQIEMPFKLKHDEIQERIQTIYLPKMRKK